MTKELIEYISKALVDNPDEVSVSVEENDQALTLSVRVANEDLGKIIGKQGRTARALRILVSAAGVKRDKRVLLEIVS